MAEQLLKKLKLEKFNQITYMKSAKEDSIFEQFSTQNYPTDLVVAYVYTLDEMKEVALTVHKEQKLNNDGQIFFLYPKTKNPLGHAPIGRDSIFPHLEMDDNRYVKGTSLKFNRMISLDDNYSLMALKTTATVEKIENKASNFDEKISEVKAILKDFPEQLAFYENLTPGYQRDWAKYIFSPKTEATKEKRKLEMIEILKAGFKTKNLYTASKK